MTKINGKPEWSEVDILENEDILTGGEEGSANKQAQALANRTEWLKENLAEQVNGKKIVEKSVIITAEDILVKGGQTIQEELERKSNRDHTHAFGGGAPEVTPEMVGKYLGVNGDGTGTEWKSLEGSRLWISEKISLFQNDLIVVHHNLNLDPLRSKCDVLIVCEIPEQGYSVGEIAILNPVSLVLSTLSLSSHQLLMQKIGTPSIFSKVSNSRPLLNPKNWQFIFRIWY